MPKSDLVARGDLYRYVLGDAWETLAPQVKGMHAPGFTAHGTLEVRHGRGAIARLLARLSGAPPEAEASAVSLDVVANDSGQTWTRAYGAQETVRVTTKQWVRDGLLVEAYAGLAVHFRIVPDASGAVVYEQVKTTIELGWLSVRLPSFFSPRARGRVGPGPAPDEAKVDVSVSAPLVGLLVSYSGTMKGSFESPREVKDP